MSNPRFRPNSYTDEPLAFGKAAVIRWRKVEAGDAGHLLAAQIQHGLAYVITTRARSEYGSMRTYAQVAGLNYDRLGKVLRGEHLLRLEDLATAEIHIGGILTSTFLPPIIQPGDKGESSFQAAPLHHEPTEINHS